MIDYEAKAREHFARIEKLEAILSIMVVAFEDLPGSTASQQLAVSWAKKELPSSVVITSRAR